MTFLLVFFELILLFFLSQWFTQRLAELTIRFTRSPSLAVGFVSIILYPGTVIHELSHLFTAEILGVRTGKLILTPKVTDNKSIQSGSVAISQTNPFKRALIGMSPLLSGLLGTITLSYFLSLPLSWYSYVFLFYLLFAIVNTLFPSPTDLKGLWGVATITTLLFVSLFALGIRITITGNISLFMRQLGSALVWSLGSIIIIDIIAILVLHIILSMMKR